MAYICMPIDARLLQNATQIGDDLHSASLGSTAVCA